MAMLIDDYRLEVYTPPCDPGAPRFAAKAHFGHDIRPLLPYLNAVLEGAEYNPGAPALRWRQGSHTIVFHPLEIAVSNIADREEAAAEVGKMVELANRTWDRRGEIEPSESVRRRPPHLALYQLLPGTNCKQCGEPTCSTFALKLSMGHVVLAACPRMAEPEHQAANSKMKALLQSG